MSDREAASASCTPSVTERCATPSPFRSERERSMRAVGTGAVRGVRTMRRRDVTIVRHRCGGTSTSTEGPRDHPGDEVYDEARTPFYGGFDSNPALIARVADAADVSTVVRLARESGVELAVRSGGHSVAGHSVSDGIVLDLFEMHVIDVDVENRTAWAETGLTAAGFANDAVSYGLGVGFGDTGSVGIGGITLGGGIGYLVRKHGLTIDDLLAAEIVTADGELLHADEDSTRTCSGRSGAEAGTSVSRRGSGSASTSSTWSSAGCSCFPRRPRRSRASSPWPMPRPGSYRRSRT